MVIRPNSLKLAPLIILLCFAGCAAPASIPAPTATGPKASTDTDATTALALAPSFDHRLGTVTPWTDRPIHDAPAQFQFAIVSDRTGGMRAGVFDTAVPRLNALQPAFVLSVGDLIDGYTESPSVWNAQWDEFNAIVDKLEMPFVYVPGNHDTSNPQLTEQWKQRFGHTYYAFTYKDVLFIGLDTEDVVGGGISEQQASYVAEMLRIHADVRWTLLFMHRPLFSYGDKAGFDKIEAALATRPYTVFAGHHHHALTQDIHGRRHYILGTTGGGSYLRGAQVGEYDHVTWVTMPPGRVGPRVVNLSLDGFVADDVVNEDNYPLVAALRSASWLEAAQIEATDQYVDSLQVSFTLTHPLADGPAMRVSGSLNTMASDVTFSPHDIARELSAGTSQAFTATLRRSDGRPLDVKALHEQSLSVQLEATFVESAPRDARLTMRPEGDLSLPAERRLSFDWPESSVALPPDWVLDGAVDEWRTQDWITVNRPGYMHEDWDWHGPQDGRFAFAVSHNTRGLVVALDVHDDQWLWPDATLTMDLPAGEVLPADALEPPQVLATRSDQFYVAVGPPGHAHTLSWTYLDRAVVWTIEDEQGHVVASGKRSTNQGARADSEQQTCHVSDAADQTPTNEWDSSPICIEMGWQDGRLTTEVYLSKSIIPQGDTPAINVGWMDHDRVENTKPSVLWWRPKLNDPPVFKSTYSLFPNGLITPN